MHGYMSAYINTVIYFSYVVLSIMDPSVNIYKAALSYQTGAGFDFPLYQGRSQFKQKFYFPVCQGRAKYGQGIGDVF